MNYTCWNFKCICLYIILDDRYVSTSYTSVQNTGWPPSKSPGICTRSLTRRGLGTCRALVGWDEPMVSSGGPVENWGDVGGVPIIRILGCIDNPSSSTSCEWRSRSKLFDLFPIGSMGLVYLPTFIPVIYHKKIQRKSVGTYTSPMDPMGLNESWIHDLFASVSFIEVHWITSQSIRWFHPLRPTSFPSTRWSPPVPMHRSPWRKHPKNNGKSWSKMWNCETFVRLHQKPSRTNMGPHGLVVFLVAWSTSCCSCRRRTSLKVVHFLAMLWWQRAEDFLPGVVWTCTGKMTLDIIHVNSWESWDHMILFFFFRRNDILIQTGNIFWTCFPTCVRWFRCTGTQRHWRWLIFATGAGAEGGANGVGMCDVWQKNEKVMSKKTNMLCWYHWWKNWYIYIYYVIYYKYILYQYYIYYILYILYIYGCICM